MGDAIDLQIDMLASQVAGEDAVEPIVVPLTRYRIQEELDASPNAGLPLGAHAMMISWLADELRGLGYEVVTSWSAR